MDDYIQDNFTKFRSSNPFGWDKWWFYTDAVEITSCSTHQISSKYIEHKGDTSKTLKNFQTCNIKFGPLQPVILRCLLFCFSQHYATRSRALAVWWLSRGAGTSQGTPKKCSTMPRTSSASILLLYGGDYHDWRKIMFRSAHFGSASEINIDFLVSLRIKFVRVKNWQFCIKFILSSTSSFL